MSFIRREVWGVFYAICSVVEITYFVQTCVLRNMDLTRGYVVIYCKALTLFSNDVNKTCATAKIPLSSGIIGECYALAKMKTS